MKKLTIIIAILTFFAISTFADAWQVNFYNDDWDYTITQCGTYMLPDGTVITFSLGEDFDNERFVEWGRVENQLDFSMQCQVTDEEGTLYSGVVIGDNEYIGVLFIKDEIEFVVEELYVR